MDFEVFIKQRAAVYYLIAVEGVEEGGELLQVLAFEEVDNEFHSRAETELDVNLYFVGQQKLPHLNEW